MGHERWRALSIYCRSLRKNRRKLQKKKELKWVECVSEMKKKKWNLSFGGVECYDDFLVKYGCGVSWIEWGELRIEISEGFQLTHVRGRGHGKCGCCVCHLTIMIRCHKGHPDSSLLYFFFSLLVSQEPMANSSLLYFFSIGLAGANGGTCQRGQSRQYEWRHGLVCVTACLAVVNGGIVLSRHQQWRYKLLVSRTGGIHGHNRPPLQIV